MISRRRTLFFALVVFAVAVGTLAWSVFYGLPRPDSNQKTDKQPTTDSKRQTKPRARITARVVAKYSIPPRGYQSPNPGVSFSPTDDTGYIKTKTLEYLTEEVRHLKAFVDDHHGTQPESVRRNMIRRTAERKLEQMKTRLDKNERKTLVNELLTREGVLEGEAQSRQQLLESIEPKPTTVPTTSDPLLIRLEETGCEFSLEYPPEFQTAILKPSFGHLELENWPDGSADFESPDFPQRIPGPMPHEHPGMDVHADTAYEAFTNEEDTIPPHPILKTLDDHPDSAFIVIGETQAYPAQNLWVTDPGFFGLGYEWTRNLEGKISNNHYDGSDVALGYVGDPHNLPKVLQERALTISRKHCLVKTLEKAIEDRHGKDATYHVAYLLGKNENTLRMVIEYRLNNTGGGRTQKWTGFLDLNERKLVVLYVPPVEGDDAHFLMDDGVTLLADRNHDDLGDLIYSIGANYDEGTLVALNGKPKIQHPKYTPD